MSRTLLVRRLIVAGALAAAPALVAFTSTPATAAARFHLALKRAEPAANDTVATSPKTISLWFTESVSPATTAIRLTNASDVAIKLGKVTVASEPNSPAVAAVSETLKPGAYTVQWRAQADDGHPSSGKFTFTVK